MVRSQFMTDIATIPPSPSEDDYSTATAEGEAGLYDTENPFSLFAEWLAAAQKTEPNDPNAMALATVDATGMPDVRMVLLKAADAQGFVFYTNTNSAKGQEIAAVPKAALTFHWKSLRRQVRVRGLIERVSDAEADAYFESRARDSRIGAWASDQSKPLDGRFALEKRVAEYALKFGLGPIPRPDFWTGFRLVPLRIEFWRDRPFRLHDRLEFTRETASTDWQTQRLFP
jgi:pyridoxamine 5'-phosphate oxidase